MTVKERLRFSDGELKETKLRRGNAGSETLHMDGFHRARLAFNSGSGTMPRGSWFDKLTMLTMLSIRTVNVILSLSKE